jgi:hypothetical protein
MQQFMTDVLSGLLGPFRVTKEIQVHLDRMNTTDPFHLSSALKHPFILGNHNPYIRPTWLFPESKRSNEIL